MVVKVVLELLDFHRDVLSQSVLGLLLGQILLDGIGKWVEFGFGVLASGFQFKGLDC